MVTAESATDRPPVIVLGSGVTALGVLRILARNGLEAYSADASERLLTRSRWFRPMPGADGSIGDVPLGEWLRQSKLDRAVLMPCSDQFVSEVASLDRGLRERFPASVPAPETLERLVDKGRFAEALRETGTPHPWSRIVETADDLAAAPDTVFESAILKPRDSQRFFKRFNVKALHVSSRSDAEERLRELRAQGFPVILQEYVPGPATQHYFVDGFVDRHGVMRAAFVRQRIRMYPTDFGNSTYMVSVPAEQAAGAVMAITRLLTHIGYRGMFSAEFKRDPRDDVFKILEVNARAWWYVDFAARSGVDVCRMAYEDALERPVGDVTGYRIGRTLVFPYTDYFACANLRRQGRLSLWAWLRSWMTSSQPVFQVSDPAPGALATASILTTFVRRRLRTLLPKR